MNGNLEIDRLSAIFARYPDIQAVYQFGSTVSGQTHAESDLDLAVVLGNPAAMPKKLDILGELARAGFCNIDLVFLNTDDIVLKYEAVRQNKLIFQRHDFDAGSYYSLILRQYLDFLPYLEVQRRAYRRRILVG